MKVEIDISHVYGDHPNERQALMGQLRIEPLFLQLLERIANALEGQDGREEAAEEAAGLEEAQRA